MRLKLWAEIEEQFEWNPYQVRLDVMLRAEGRGHSLTKFYPRDFLESEFDLLWRVMGEELKEGIRADQQERK